MSVEDKKKHYKVYVCFILLVISSGDCENGKDSFTWDVHWSERPSTMFLKFRLIWASWKWSQMIPITQKHRDRCQKQVFRVFRTKITISLHEVILRLLQPLHSVLDLQTQFHNLLEIVFGLLQPLHHVLDLWVDLRFLKIVPNDFPWPKGVILFCLGDQGSWSCAREGDLRGLIWVGEGTKYWHFWSK